MWHNFVKVGYDEIEYCNLEWVGNRRVKFHLKILSVGQKLSENFRDIKLVESHRIHIHKSVSKIDWKQTQPISIYYLPNAIGNKQKLKPVLLHFALGTTKRNVS